jgi:hypothetical protein
MFTCVYKLYIYFLFDRNLRFLCFTFMVFCTCPSKVIVAPIVFEHVALKWLWHLWCLNMSLWSNCGTYGVRTGRSEVIVAPMVLGHVAMKLLWHLWCLHMSLWSDCGTYGVCTCRSEVTVAPTVFAHVDLKWLWHLWCLNMSLWSDCGTYGVFHTSLWSDCGTYGACICRSEVIIAPMVFAHVALKWLWHLSSRTPLKRFVHFSRRR